MKFWDSNGYNDQGTMDESSPFDDLFKLSRTQRLYGFGICFGLGFIISILSTLMLITGNIPGFAVLYTSKELSKRIQFSTGFLVGFAKQIKTMFAPVRWLASTVFIASMVLTLVVAFLLKDAGFVLCIVMCVVQFLALFWYCASYIPYGR
ncbi:9154_t:CDS:2, partial [Gigaspora rosea]